VSLPVPIRFLEPPPIHFGMYSEIKIYIQENPLYSVIETIPEGMGCLKKIIVCRKKPFYGR